MDSFVIQLHGSKLWHLWPSLESHSVLPNAQLKRKPSHAELSALPSPDVLELRAGDVLYLPRGVVHEATTVGLPHPTESLHLTVGLLVDPQTSTEALLHAALDEAGNHSTPVRATAAADQGAQVVEEDSRAILHAVFREAASQPGATSLRRSLPPFSHAARLNATDAILELMRQEEVWESLASATAALQAACRWSARARAASDDHQQQPLDHIDGRQPNTMDRFALPSARCADNDPPRNLATRDVLTVQLAALADAAYTRVEREALRKLGESQRLRSLHLAWHTERQHEDPFGGATLDHAKQEL